MSKVKRRLEIINKKIDFIQNICQKANSIYVALEDEETTRASILMHLTSIAEQFHKLKQEGEAKTLDKFNADDIKGSYDVRIYIAHDYEGVNLSIIEHVIREKLPKLKTTIQAILKEED
jgi:uncharacterized protein with HEPN domain